MYTGKAPGSVVVNTHMADNAVTSLKNADPSTLPANVMSVQTASGQPVVATTYVFSLSERSHQRTFMSHEFLQY